MSENAIISIKDVVNQFGEFRIHDGLDLEIQRGDILGIVGGSGTGKSVLLRTILGLNTPKSGNIIYQDQDILKISASKMQKIQENWGTLFQNGALFSSLTVLENVMAPMREHTRMSKATMAEIAHLKIAMSGLAPEAADKYPSELSGGMKKRAALARALALDPEVLFLDEPTAGLDPIGAAKFDELIRDLQNGLGITVVIVTHDLDTLFTICDRVAVLIDKKIVADTLENLLNYDHPWIKEYFHGPRARAANNGN